MSKDKKKLVLVISDHPFAPSGVGSQTKYVLDSLIKTGRYKFICLGGAIKHEKYEPQKIQGDWDEDDWIIYPVDGYGNPEMIRSLLWTYKPDMLWFMTDPRFYPWLWQIENEIRSQIPMIYYHVWDNYPAPKYNKVWYDSTDVIASISKVTHDIVNKVSPEVENHYLPHAVDGNIFKKRKIEEIEEFYDNNQLFEEDRFTFFWNNRNARRKQSGTLILWFSEFAKEVGSENVRLIMHTDPRDAQGSNLEEILKDFDILDKSIIFSASKVPPDALSVMYNVADCTINIADAEGFGLATLESLSCGTPIIVNMTGGLQEQVTDGKEWFGIGIEPVSKALIGSQPVPYIYEDRISKEDFIAALHKMYNMPKEEREELGRKGAEHVRKNYNFEDFEKKWVELMDDIHERLGSWDTRKGYKSWTIKEIK
jgi:glycosyltransferase involved in cell wall biosynthesis